MYWGKRESECDALLKRELEDARYEVERVRSNLESLQEAQRQAEKDRRRERQAMYARQERSASDWPECLKKQRSLFNAEAYLDGDGGDSDRVGGFFMDCVRAIDRALELWMSESKKVQPQIDDLQRQIDELRNGIRFVVAERISVEGLSADVANALNEYDDDSCEEWLNW